MKIIVLLLIAISLMSCSQSGTVTSSEYEAPTTIIPSGATTPSNTSGTVVPGVSFSVTDMFISTSTLNVVVKNNSSKALPSFAIDYTLLCGSDYKDYNSKNISLGSYEQKSLSFYVTYGKIGNYCSLTFTSVRSGCGSYSWCEPFVSWNGNYTVNTNMF